MAADDSRLTSLEGIKTSAKNYEGVHNLKVNPHQIVSSDGFLFLVSASTLRHIYVLWDMVQDAQNHGEIVLVDERFETANTIRFVLDLLLGTKLEVRFWASQVLDNVFRFTDKYDCPYGYQLAINSIHGGLALPNDFKDKEQKLVEIFCLAARFDEERLATTTVGVMEYCTFNNPTMARNFDQQRLFSPLNVGSWPPSALQNVPGSYLWSLARAALHSFQSRREDNNGSAAWKQSSVAEQFKLALIMAKVKG